MNPDLRRTDDEEIERGIWRAKYVPRPQFMPFHRRSQRFACMVFHRRAGKTVASINEAVARAIYTKKEDARYAYIAPFRNQAKDLAWTYLRRFTDGISSKVSESELSVTLSHNKARIRIYGADNPESFRGIYLDGVVIDEYGDMSPIIWGTILLPTLMDRKGWAVFIGTFKGRNHFWKTYERSCGRLLGEQDGDPEYFKKNWFSYLLKASNSSIYTKEEFLSIRRETDEDEYEQEYECNPDAAVKGTYYAKHIAELQLRGQIYSSAADYDPNLPVGIFSDLGRSDSTALWFYQRRPGGYALIDYEESHSKGVGHYADLVASKPYKYEVWWVPHDAKAKTLSTERSTIEQLVDFDSNGKFVRWDAGAPLMRLSPRLAVQHGVDAVRKILPDCHFHQRTEAGVEALRAYSRRWDDITKSYADDPLHNWASHGSDAFRYFALGVRDFNAPSKILLPRVATPIIEAPKITLDMLWADRRASTNYRSRV